MLNNFLLFFSGYFKQKKINLVFIIMLIINILIMQLTKVKIEFVIINILIVLLITLLTNLTKNKYIHALLSINGIIIWSIMIDIVSFYMFPMFSSNTTLLTYISNGILFNIKYVIINTILIVFFKLLSLFIIKNKNIIKSSNIVLTFIKNQIN